MVISFLVLAVALAWFFAALAGMWVSVSAPEFSRRQTVATWAYTSFLCALCLVGLAIGVGVLLSGPR